jgi:hypothetical protein
VDDGVGHKLADHEAGVVPARIADGPGQYVVTERAGQRRTRGCGWQ